MTDHGVANHIPSIRLTQIKGSAVTGRQKDKLERIGEAINDLQLVIDGCQFQLTPDAPAEQFSQSVAALARASSVFLRKLVLGDRNDKATRLLDDDVCEAMGLKFHKLVKVAGARKPIDISFDITRGYVDVTKKNDETLLPEYTHRIPIGPQKLNIMVEWPLPGLANWVDEPHDGEVGDMRPGELFDLRSEPTFSCDDWLNQQLVLFDGKGISLKETLRTIANTEGAHSVSVGRLKEKRGERPQKFIRRQRLNILNNITFGSLKYNHIIVIETALYLYERIMQHRVTKGEIKGYYMPAIRVVSDFPPHVSSIKPRPIGFQGGLILGLGGQGQIISHKIRATK